MDDQELHLQIEKRLSKVEERMDGMEAWVSKLEVILNGVARVEDVKKLMDAVKGKNTALLTAVIGGFFGLAGTLFGLLKP